MYLVLISLALVLISALSQPQELLLLSAGANDAPAIETKFVPILMTYPRRDEW